MFDSSIATKIYQDEIMGMSTVNTLSYWYGAFYGKKGSDAYQVLVDYYTNLGIYNEEKFD